MTNFSKVVSKYIYHHHHHHQPAADPPSPPPSSPSAHSSSLHSIDSDYSSSSSDSNLNDLDSVQSQPQQPYSFIDSLPIQFVKFRADPKPTAVATSNSSAFKYYTQFLNSIPRFSELKPSTKLRSNRYGHYSLTYSGGGKSNKSNDSNPSGFKKPQQPQLAHSNQGLVYGKQSGLNNRSGVLECGESTSLKKNSG